MRHVAAYHLPRGEATWSQEVRMHRFVRFGAAVVVGFGFAASVGCSGDEEHDEGPICTEIADACHHVAEMGDNQDAVDCHDLAHEADEDACSAEHDACVELCEAAEATMEM